jgi:DNA-binding Xre family transcriptional regulator
MPPQSPAPDGGADERPEEQAGLMFFRLSVYLEELAAIERTKPENQRRQVPTMKELAAAAHVNPANLSRLVTGRIGSLNFRIGVAILDEFHRRGFHATPNDIIAYIPPGKE